MKYNVTVPAEPFARIVRDMIAAEEQLDGIAPVTAISKRIEFSARRVYALVNGELANIEFPTADRIVTYGPGPMAWHEDPELAEIYRNVNLRLLDWAEPVTDRIRTEQDKQIRKAYKQHGTYPATAAALGCSVNRVKILLGPKVSTDNVFRIPICRYGHDKRVTGVHANGYCAECKRIREKERIRKVRAAHKAAA